MSLHEKHKILSYDTVFIPWEHCTHNVWCAHVSVCEHVFVFSCIRFGIQFSKQFRNKAI